MARLLRLAAPECPYLTVGAAAATLNGAAHACYAYLMAQTVLVSTNH